MSIKKINKDIYNIKQSYNDPAQKKAAKNQIKGLSQDQRALLIKILNAKGSDATFDPLALRKLHAALKEPRNRTHYLHQSLSRAWKNYRHNRIQSKEIFELMTPKPIENITDLEKRLHLHSSKPLQAEEIKGSIHTYAHEITEFFMNHPDLWTPFSKKIKEKCQDPSIDKIFFQLDYCFNTIHTQKLFNGDIAKVISSFLPSREDSLLKMGMLAESFPADVIANWAKQHGLPLHKLPFKPKDIEQIAQYYEKIDLSHLGEEKPVKKDTWHLGFYSKISFKDLEFINAVFKDTKWFYFTNLSEEESWALKSFKKLELLHLNGCQLTSTFLLNLSKIKKLEDFYATECHLAKGGLKLLKNLTSLSIKDCQGFSPSDLISLTKLYHFSFTGSKIPSLSTLPENVKSLDLDSPDFTGLALPEHPINLKIKTKNLSEECLQSIGNAFVTSLELEVNELPNDDLNFHHLKELTIKGGYSLKLTEIQLASLSQLKHLKKLSLKQIANPFSEEVLQQFIHLKELKIDGHSPKDLGMLSRLTHLELMHFSVSIQTEVFPPNLTHLTLWGSIPQKTLDALKKLPKLKALSILLNADQEFTPKQRDELKALNIENLEID